MTELTPTPVETAPVVPAPFQVTTRSNSRLAQLHSMYSDAKAKAAQAAEELKVITDGIKAEMAKAAPQGTTRIELPPANGVDAPVLRLVYTESWRVDAKKLKASDPETYVRYAVKGGSWTLKTVSAGEE